MKIQKFKFIIIAIIGLIGVLKAQTFSSENGSNMPVNADNMVLYVFVEATGNCNWIETNASPDFASGVIPSDANAYLDDVVSPNFSSYLSKYYNEISLGELNVIGDYHKNVVTVDCNNATNAEAARQLSLQWEADADGVFRTARGHSIAEFDQYGSSRYENKLTGPDGIIDATIFLWRNHNNFRCQRGWGVGNRITNSVSIGDKSISTFGAWGYCPNSGYNQKNMFITEYFHALFGGNNYHTSGGEGTSTFPDLAPCYSTTMQSGTSKVVCGWDRHHLGYRGNRQFTISAQHPTSKAEVVSDLRISTHPNKQEFLLRDFVTVGDAIRIKLPHFDWQQNGDVKNQYLWLENHQKISFIDKDFWENGDSHCRSWNKGLYAYFQVGKDIKNSTTGSDIEVDFSFRPELVKHPNSLNSYLRQITWSGNYDFYYEYSTQNENTGACQWGNKSLPFGIYFPNGETKPNPFNGANDLYNPNVNQYKPKSQKYTGIPNENPPLASSVNLGSSLAFNRTGEMISIATNPSSAPLYTLTQFAENTIGDYENREILLNGIKVVVLSTDYYNNNTGVYHVSVEWDNYNVNSDARWTGNIVLQNDVLDPLQRQSKIRLKFRKELTLDRSETATLILSQPFTDGTNSVAEPTVLTLKSGTTLIIEDYATLKLKNKSSIVAEAGSTIQLLGSGKILVEYGSNLCLKDGSNLIVDPRNDLGIVRYLQNGNTLNVLGSVYPRVTSIDANVFLKETSIFSSITCNGFGFRDPFTGTKSKAFYASKVKLLPGFKVGQNDLNGNRFLVKSTTYNTENNDCDNIYYVDKSTTINNFETPDLETEGGNFHNHDPYAYPDDLYTFLHGHHHGHDHNHLRKESEETETLVNTNKLGLAPNPTTSKVKLTTGFEGESQIVLTDLSGKELQTFTTESNEIDIDLSANANGMYFFRIKNHLGSHVVKVMLSKN